MVNFKNLAVVATTLFSYALAAPMMPENGEFMLQGEVGQVIQGKYLVALKSGLKTRDLDNHLEWVNTVHKRSISRRQFKGVERTFAGQYDFHGYSGSFDESTLAEIRKNPEVELVEEDKIWTIQYIQEPEEEKTFTLSKKALTTQTNAPWGLGSISHREPGSTDYIHDDNAGKDTFAYIVDSGIRATHVEFEGRASLGFSAFPEDKVDAIGHGTHVAGTIAGKTYGVAKKATIIAAKVFQGRTASTATILSGFNWAADDIVAKGRTKNAVINMSLGGPKSDIFDKAVESAAASGVLSVVAAGNENVDAGNSSPASTPSAITVGSVDSDWNISVFSNWGKVLDIFGPGTNIKSAWIRNDNDVNTISGTSMATPHIVGLALYAISVDGITGVKEITEHLLSSATKGVVKGDLHGSVNLLANNNNSEQN